MHFLSTTNHFLPLVCVVPLLPLVCAVPPALFGIRYHPNYLHIFLIHSARIGTKSARQSRRPP